MNSRKIWKVLLDTVEIYIPLIIFLIMFIVFVVEIFARYLFNYPLDWSFEVSNLTYVWTAILGACYTTRKHEHVCFTLIYEKFSSKGRLIANCLGNLLVIIAFIIAIYPSYSYIMAYHNTHTAVLGIPLDIGFMPFLVSTVFIISHLIYDTVNDIRKLISKKYDVDENITNNAI
ncbi:TRAP transporter small permease [Caldicoprobacter algeriensis]|uniref:TRAP transporter small permease n=1 Tax=Caldicoprobacter algeriensis TaxID=699281 RepID=UPI00207ADFD3|nr:TRAP transporter small permease [Caldicoprobacter algeriensis]MCM8900196.1 TRAP transporter small permease [Caldicoprobacter algeriensis]